MNEQNNNTNGFKEFFASSLGKLVVMVVSGIIIYGLIIVGLSAATPVFIITMLLCGYFGWKALNRITPSIFLVLSFTGWFIYFFVKGMLSVVVGAFVAPYQIGKMLAAYASDIANK